MLIFNQFLAQNPSIPNQNEDAGFGMWKRSLSRERNRSAIFGNVTAKKVVIASRNSFGEVSKQRQCTKSSDFKGLTH